MSQPPASPSLGRAATASSSSTSSSEHREGFSDNEKSAISHLLSHKLGREHTATRPGAGGGSFARSLPVAVHHSNSPSLVVTMITMTV
jgi:hypothetical protein